MRALYSFLFLFLISISFVSGAEYPQPFFEVNYTTDNDTYVNNAAASTNYGSETLIQFQFDNSPSKRGAFRYTKYPYSADILNATWNSYMVSRNLVIFNDGAYFGVCNDSFNELNLTWNNFGTEITDCSSSVFFVDPTDHTAGTWLTYTSASFLSGVTNAPLTFTLKQISQEGPSSQTMNLASKEYTDPNNASYIWVSYSHHNFSIIAFDISNNNSITNFSVEIEGVGNFTTTNGSVMTSILRNSSQLLNITLSSNESGGYFNKTYLNHNTTDHLQAILYQAQITFLPRNVITNTSLSGGTFSASLSSGGYEGNPLNFSSGANNVTYNKTGYIVSSTEYTFSALESSSRYFYAYNATLNITATLYNGTPANNFTINLSSNDYDWWEEKNTTNGWIEFEILNGSYTINFNGDIYAATQTQINVTNGSNSYDLSIFTENSINITIYDIDTLSLITDNVTIKVISNLTSFQNSTTTGSLYVDLLTPNSYELRLSSQNYSTISKFVTVTQDSTQTIAIYMTKNSTTELQIVEVLDTANEPVEGAIVWLQKEVIGESEQYYTVQEAQTNYEGKTTLWVEKSTDVYYRIAVIYEDEARPIEPSGELYTNKFYFIPDVTETIQLIINLEEDPTDYIGERYSITTSLEFSGVDNNTIVFDFIDALNSISGGKLLVYGKYLNSSMEYVLVSTQTVSNTFGQINYTFTPINNTIYKIEAYILYSDREELVGEKEKRFEVDIIVDKQLGLLLTVFIMMVLYLITARFGPLISSIIPLSALWIIRLFGFVDLPTAIITSLIALALLLFFSTRKK